MELDFKAWAKARHIAQYYTQYYTLISIYEFSLVLYA